MNLKAFVAYWGEEIMKKIRRNYRKITGTLIEMILKNRVHKVS